MITKVTGKNQVTVPAKITASEGIHPGTRLDWQVTDQEHVLLIRVLPDRSTLASQLRGNGQRYRKTGSDPIKSLIRQREQEDRERYKG